MIEEHGPHLPVGADTLGVMYQADGVSRRVSRALPAWNVVMMPAINYGQGGANALGNMLVHPGTYAIRQSTLRSLVADLGGQIAQNGFKWMFVMNGHGGPPHNIAINEACDFVSETFGVTMLHLTGLFRADAVIQAKGQRMNASTFRPRSWPRSAWTFMPASAKHRACSPSVPIWFGPITKRFRAERAARSRSCARLRRRPVGRAISLLRRRRRRRTAGRSRPGGSTGLPT